MTVDFKYAQYDGKFTDCRYPFTTTAFPKHSMTITNNNYNAPVTPEAESGLAASAWKRLTEARSTTELVEAWLELQCGMITDCVEGLTALDDKGDFSAVTHWPDEQTPSQALIDTAQRAMAEKTGVVLKWPNEGAALAYPILIEQQLAGVVAVLIESEDAQLNHAMRQLQWGVAWVRDQLRLEQNHAARQIHQQTVSALNIVATSLEHKDFEGACQSTVTELALNANSERVSIAFVKDIHAKVRAISHSAQFGQRMNLNRMVEAAMDEAIDQRAIILYPPPAAGEVLSVHAHKQLSAAHNATVLLTIPLLANEETIGALLFERPKNNVFEQSCINALSAVASLLGPVLEEKRLNDQWLIVKTGVAIKRQISHLFGPKHALKKLLIFSTVAVLLLSMLVTGTYQVTADSTIEGVVKRSIVAAFDGYIQVASVRAGDLVNQGELMVAIDDRDIALEKLRLITEQQEKKFAQERAMSERNRAEVKVIKAQVKKLDAQLRQIDEQLSRAKHTAPFNGMVVSGDLTQSIGGAVRRGDVLFDIAPLDEYRVVILVDESQIADIRIGQLGLLQVAAIPDERFELEIDRITPIAASADGSNTFRVDGHLTTNTNQLRPGMKGITKIEVGERNLFWIWARPLLTGAKLFIWRWLG